MLTRAIFRALCALLVGFLLVSNPTDMTVLIVQIIGGLFTLSGIVAIIGYFTNRARRSGFRPVFPIVGLGSLAFGVLLLVWPVQFVSILMYVLGILLALIGIGQMVNLISYRKFSPLTWSLFVLPMLFIATGVLVILYPMEAASLPFTILGIGYLIYGVSEFLLGIRFYRFRRLYDAEQERLQAEAVHDAEAEEITEEEDPALEQPADDGAATVAPLLIALILSAATATLSAQTKDFTVAAMNVDGLPKEINLVVRKIELNPDSKGSAGAQAISQKLATKSYDIIGLSEDFNYHGSIMSAIGDTYNAGTHRGSIDASSITKALFNGVTLDTDGLELLWKKNLYISCESWTRWNAWNGKTDQGADGLVKKGFRYYLADLGDGVLVDIYILHMDAETNPEDNAARESQMLQLADDILRINPSTRPKIVMGDTNCRYTRDKLQELFIDRINADGRYTIKDCWIEKCKKNKYPALGSDALLVSDLGYTEGEIVDKIFYINPVYGMKLQLRSFKVDTDFNDADGTPLADHYPVVASFRTTGTLLDPRSYWQTSTGDDAAYNAYAQAYQAILPLTASPLQKELKEELNELLTTHTNKDESTGPNGITGRLLAFPDKVKAYLEENFMEEDYTDNIKNPSFEEGVRLATGQVSGWTVANDVAEAFISGVEDNDEGAAVRWFAPIDGRYVFNTWGGTPANGFYCQQEVSLINGWYKLTATVASDVNDDARLFLGNSFRSSGPLTDRTQGVRVELIAYGLSKTTLGMASNSWFECDDFRLTRYKTIPNKVEDILTAGNGAAAIYTPDGRLLSSPRRGLNIIRRPDGSIHKLLLR